MQVYQLNPFSFVLGGVVFSTVWTLFSLLLWNRFTSAIRWVSKYCRNIREGDL